MNTILLYLSLDEIYSQLTMIESIQLSNQINKSQKQKNTKSIMKILENQQQHMLTTKQKKSEQNFIPSNHYNSYFRYLYEQSQPLKQNKCQFLHSDFKLKIKTQMNRLVNILKNNQIIYNCQAIFQKQIEIVVVKACMDCTIISVKWGRFTMEISLYRMYLNSKDIHNQDILGEGCFSKVFTVYHKDNQYAIKSILLDAKSSKEQIKGSQLLFAISEYFISKIASTLEVGPKVYNIFGFDLVVYNDCAEFSMQLCNQIQIYTENYEYIEEQLKQNLKLLHLFNICHLDIKPQNILFSPAYKKTVFIDFGLSKLFIEAAGYKSYTSFVGTYIFCSDEMKNIYSGKKKDYIDMYFNDTECLQETIRRSLVKEKVKDENQNWFESVSLKSKPEDIQLLLQKQPCRIKYLINLLLIKYSILNQDYNRALILISQQKYMLRTINKIFTDNFPLSRRRRKINKRNFQSALKNIRIGIKLQQTIKFDIIIFQYLKQCEQKNYFKMYLAYFSLILKDTRDIQGFQDKRYCLDKLSQFLSPSNDPFLIQQIKNRNITRNNFIQFAYKQILLRNKTHPTNIKQPTFLYKAHTVLKILSKKIIQTKNQKILHYIRDSFMAINDYASCLEIENIILDLVKQEKQWSFVLRMVFFLERTKWFTNAHIYSDQQWLQQVKNTEISNKEGIQSEIKNLAILILSKTLSKQCRGRYKQCSLIIQKICNKYKILPHLEQKLMQIQKYCQSMTKLIQKVDNSVPNIELYIKQQINIRQDNIFQSLTPTDVQSFIPYNGGYYYTIRMLPTFQDTTNLITQLIQLSKKNRKLLKYQIERIIGNNLCFNIKAKIQLFKIYIQSVWITADAQYLQIFQMLNMLICTLKNTMLYIEKKQEITKINISIQLQIFLANIKRFFQQIQNGIQISSNKELKQNIPESLIIVADILTQYVPDRIQQFLSVSLRKIKIFITNKQHNYFRFYNLKFILQQLKFIYRVFDYRGADIDELIISYFYQSINYDSVSIILTMPDIIPILIKIHLQHKYSIPKLIQLILTLLNDYQTKFIRKQDSLKAAINYASLQYMFIQAIEKICFDSKQLDIQFFINQLLRKYGLSQICQNHLLAIVYVYVFFYSANVKTQMQKSDVKKFFVITNLSMAFIKSPRIRFSFVQVAYKQYRKLFMVSKKRKDMCLLKKQAKANSKQSCKKLSQLIQNKITINKKVRFNNSELQNRLKQVLSQKYEKIKKILSQNQLQYLDI